MWVCGFTHTHILYPQVGVTLATELPVARETVESRRFLGHTGMSQKVARFFMVHTGISQSASFEKY